MAKAKFCGCCGSMRQAEEEKCEICGSYFNEYTTATASNVNANNMLGMMGYMGMMQGEPVKDDFVSTLDESINVEEKLLFDVYVGPMPGPDETFTEKTVSRGSDGLIYFNEYRENPLNKANSYHKVYRVDEEVAGKALSALNHFVVTGGLLDVAKNPNKGNISCIGGRTKVIKFRDENDNMYRVSSDFASIEGVHYACDEVIAKYIKEATRVK